MINMQINLDLLTEITGGREAVFTQSGAAEEIVDFPVWSACPHFGEQSSGSRSFDMPQNLGGSRRCS